jgi:glycosyltransferase involved in cell wall biosynthesis
MNIAIVSLSRGYHSKTSIGLIITRLARHLVEKGHNVHLIVRRSCPDESDVEVVDGIKIVRYYSPYPQSNLFPFYPLFAAVNACRALMSIISEVDLINYHSAIPAFLFEVMRSDVEIPRVMTFHSPVHREWILDNKALGLGVFESLGIYGMRLVEGFVLNRMEKIVVLSDYMREEAQCLTKKNLSFAKIPGGVDTSVFDSQFDKSLVRSQLGLSDESFVFLTVRRLVPRMGIENLVTAFEITLRRCPNCMLLIAGKGRLKRRIEDLIVDMGLQDKVRLLGYVSDDVLVSLYQASDVFVLPTKSLEGFGLVILESMATNTPVIGTDVGAIGEVLGAFNDRLIIRSSSPLDISDKMISAVLNPDSLSLYQDYIDMVKREFEWEVQMAKYEDLFCSLVSSLN